MQSKFDEYDIRYLQEQYYKMKDMYEKDEVGADKEEAMLKAFKSYDKDGNGVLDKKEIVSLLQTHFKEQGVHKKPSKDDVEAFFKNVDEDGNGNISFDEFKHFLIGNMKKRLLKPLYDYLTGKGVSLEA